MNALQLHPLPNEIVIEKGIPFPEPRGGNVSNRFRLAFRTMKIMDSFFIQKMNPSVYQFARREGMRAKVKPVPGGFRVWRVK